MIDNKIITLAVDRSVHQRIYEAHQGEQLSRTFTMQFSSNGNILALTSSDTVKANVMIGDELIDTIDGTVNANANIATITLSQRAMCVSGMLTIKVTLTNDTSVLTAESLLLRVTPTADKTYLTPPESDIVKKIVSEFKLIQNSVMSHITRTATISNQIFSLSKDEIASNSPVEISYTRGGGNSTLIRADGAELIDQLTGKVIDVTMTEVEITANDIIAGVKLTEGGTLTVKYYNKNCEDLLRRINNINNGSREISIIHNIDNATTQSEVITAEEAEL